MENPVTMHCQMVNNCLHIGVLKHAPSKVHHLKREITGSNSTVASDGGVQSGSLEEHWFTSIEFTVVLECY